MPIDPQVALSMVTALATGGIRSHRVAAALVVDDDYCGVPRRHASVTALSRCRSGDPGGISWRADTKPQVLALSAGGNYHAWVLSFAPNGVTMNGTSGRLGDCVVVATPCVRASEAMEQP